MTVIKIWFTITSPAVVFKSNPNASMSINEKQNFKRKYTENTKFYKIVDNFCHKSENYMWLIESTHKISRNKKRNRKLNEQMIKFPRIKLNKTKIKANCFLKLELEHWMTVNIKIFSDFRLNLCWIRRKLLSLGILNRRMLTIIRANVYLYIEWDSRQNNKYIA